MADINLDLFTNVEKSLKEIENFSKQSSKSLEGVEKSFEGLEKSANDFGKSSAKSASLLEGALGAVKFAAGAAIALFAGKQVVDFFSSGIDAAKEQEKAIKTLNVSLALAGDYSEAASEQFVNFADALEDSTGFSDDQSLKLVALAKSFGATNEQAKKIVETSINFGTTGASVEGTVEGLSKSLNGFKSSLSKTVPELVGLTKEQRKSGLELEILNKKYLDAAATLNKGFAGSVERVGNKFEDILKPIGALITKNPIVIASIDLFSKALGELGDILVRNKKSIIEFTVVVFEGLIQTIADLIKGFSFLGDAFDGIKFALAGLGLAYATFYDAAVSGIVSLASTFIKFASIAISPLVDQIEGLVKVLNKVGAVSDDTAQTVSNISKVIKKTGEDGTDAFDGVVKVIGKFKTNAEEAFQAAVDGSGSTKKSMIAAATAIENFGNSAAKTGRESLNAAAAFEQLNKNADKSKKNNEEQAKALEDTTTALKSLREALQKSQDVKSPIEAARREQDERLKLIQDGLDKGLLLESEAAKLRSEINIDAADKTAKEVDKINKERLDKEKKRQEEFIASIRKASAEGLASPLITASQASAGISGVNKLFGGSADDGSGFASKETAGQIAQATGLIAASLEGAAGATKLISSGFATIADVLVPGIGGAVGQIVGILAQGPEKVRELITGFAKAFPEILKNINESIPVVIEVLADQSDEIIIALVKQTPQIIKALIKAIPEITKALVIELPIELGKALGEELSRVTGASLKEAFAEFQVDVARVGRQFTDEVQLGAVRTKDAIGNAGKSFGGQISNASKSAVEAFQRIPQTIQEGLESFRSSLALAGSQFLVGIQDGLVQIRDGLSNFVTSIPSAATAFYDKVVESIAALPEQIGGLFLTVFEGIALGIQSAFTFVIDGIYQLGTSIGTAIFQAFEGLKTAIGTAGADFKREVIKNLGSGLATTFSDLGKKLKISIPDIPTLKLPKFPTLDVKFDFPPIEIPSFKIEIPGLDTITSKAKSIIPGFFAEGGLVPAGFPNDTYPARLSSGENVIDRSLNERLDRFLSSQGNQATAQPTRIVLQVGEKQLADVMLNINRQGFRTS